MRYIKPTNRIKITFDQLFLGAVIVLSFVYFIVYRTESRSNWYTESYRQVEILIQELRDQVGMK